ncbi:response regulator transcription factor [Mucilaginibacter lappiensis]|uniref:DNA-binding NarL/FixJ family response regulator n=1 Tax=Mucilaginibacter lappiensis TaxID=354630 RepID=A0A1N6RWN3_9SPHI|nr:response regulator transcription factor [Mucilaginibacter lappiensis]MBB6108560.1 DNA-binding NarL/FixJ family response regulator [Mucilaginibacter lappiensis]MBB6129447.1 DNA-binding NarL/FixJ family response regulator [Mucilaginibacter lappiensis]SIQ33189.1 two component transcriptional regulator, LuxR family [Mucilaginibacter lappiensis]
MQQDKIILAIVDDHPMVIEGLKSLLKSETAIYTSVSFTKGREFISFLSQNEVNLVFLDISLPDANGIELCKEIKKISPKTIVLGLSNQTERSMMLQMLQSGASGYLLKNVSPDELLTCIQEALHGLITFSREAKEIMGRPSKAGLNEVASVTKREKQILQLLAQGKTTAAIATELFLSPLTVDTHRKNLLQKFEVKNTAELLMAAVHQKLL